MECLESQGNDFFIFSRSRNGQSAVTGQLVPSEAEGAWTAQLSDGGVVTLRWQDGNRNVLLRKERRGEGEEEGTARRLLESQDWMECVRQPLSSDEVMKIEAAPGSGKTTALREWCRVNVDKRVLFLSYSKSVQIQQEANCSELANVAVRTVHSVAYEAMNIQSENVGELSKSAVKRILETLAEQGQGDDDGGGSDTDRPNVSPSSDFLLRFDANVYV